MKKIEVIIKGKTVIELLEDAKKGDYVDLEDVLQVDTSIIERTIDEHRDHVYASRLAEVEKKYREEIAKEVALKELEMTKKIQKEEDVSSDLRHKLEQATKEIENQKKIAAMEAQEKMLKRIAELEKIIAEQKAALEKSQLEKGNELLVQKDNLEKKHQVAIKALEDQVSSLSMQKISMSVKQIGEDLEAWCNREVTTYMQNGLENCVWEKDNTVVKNDDESKGTKADYIFSIYSSAQHTELLASVCLEMKDESPLSTHHHKNKDFYEKLDKDRKKKNCKYAVLVSNLSAESSNDLPIYRVVEYQDMYVVRPQYLMIFLNLLTSLTKRFAELVTQKESEKLDFKDRQEVLDDFEKIKETYLDKPLESMSNNLEVIRKQAEHIRDASIKIDDAVSKIINSYLNVIKEKISKFEIKLDKDLRKIGNL